MKLSSKKENKDKIIEIIKGFFDTKFIEETARLTKFVQRESKLQCIIFFSMCVYSKAGRDDKFGRFMQGIAKRRDQNQKTKFAGAV
jgi:hypothetical protein